MSMITRKTWKEFRDTQMLWWINRILHAFGWAIVFEISETGEVIEVYPARVKFRGFDASAESEGFVKLSEYLDANAKELLDEARDS